MTDFDDIDSFDDLADSIDLIAELDLIESRGSVAPEIEDGEDYEF